VEFTLLGIWWARLCQIHTWYPLTPRFGHREDLRGVRFVASLDSAALPQEHGKVASGYYVLPIEPNWFLYRFEYENKRAQPGARAKRAPLSRLLLPQEIAPAALVAHLDR